MSTTNNSGYERTRTNQRKWGRPFDLQTDGEWLARYFNLATAYPQMRDRVAPLQEIVTRLSEMTAEVTRNWAELKPDATFSVSAHEETERKKEDFNAPLRAQTWHIELDGFIERNGKAVPSFIELPSEGSEAGKMFRLIQLARAGLIDRLKKCAWCGIWFFARKSWAECHSKACYKAKTRSTEEFRERNRVDQVKYYRQKLSPYQRYYKKGLSPSEVRHLLRSKEKNNAKKR
jgi:hypothetical protein